MPNNADYKTLKKSNTGKTMIPGKEKSRGSITNVKKDSARFQRVEDTLKTQQNSIKKTDSGTLPINTKKKVQ